MQKLIGTTPLLVKHHSVRRYGDSSASQRAASDFDVDDSFNDMSLAVGDISVQVVHNSKD